MTEQIDLGHGRGWASPTAAASIFRIDRQLGRPADINEAGRSPEKANENRRKWLDYERYLNGGPWAPKAPFALGADESVHCQGDAADSDDWYDPRAAAVWRDNGWRQTARYPGNPTKDEPWHGEHFEHLDNHRFDPAPAGGATITREELDMAGSPDIWNIVEKNGDDPSSGRIYFGTESGEVFELIGYSRELISVAYFQARPAVAGGPIPDLIPTFPRAELAKIRRLHRDRKTK
ncbi:hypothetical protein SRABI98_03555 [Microbacterium sp. Bi98]|uniref:hypothetical protein n=1 Tax=Microbacterium sp. Bi98 TaxID=2821116 RepID=UPI001D3F61D9|nr:hypothetical protein [Microbacterium sp. Bi98]CAH0262944.1 hypothetical protein SRABI98_03555 [Microbacterium sp. Bi98]